MNHTDLIDAVSNRAESQGSLGSVSSRQADRDKIQADIDAFIAAGGQIQTVGTVIHEPEQKLSWLEIRSRFRISNRGAQS